MPKRTKGAYHWSAAPKPGKMAKVSKQSSRFLVFIQLVLLMHQQVNLEEWLDNAKPGNLTTKSLLVVKKNKRHRKRW